MGTVLRSSVAEPTRVCGVSYADQPCVVLACDGHNDTWPEQTEVPDIFELSGRLYTFKAAEVTCIPCLHKEVERLRALARPPALDRAVQSEIARAFGVLLHAFVFNERQRKRAATEHSVLLDDDNLEVYARAEENDAICEFRTILHTAFSGD